ncbi:hypothetical protein CFC21_031961 [Triticum aestivum]|uniref:Receptor-like serine/threonine-protein kinase n=2 Tax=Triticum aestivum TaxID=4565 RepID=A0A3B6DLC6_WHEAT|nr:hypothetical protein CFC21_031961 [Triticum aestivum]
MELMSSYLISLLLFSFLVLSPRAFAAEVTDTLGKGQNVTDGETLVSAGGSFTLGFFSPGVAAKRYLGIWFTLSEDVVCWVANSERPLSDSYGALVISAMGSLLLLDSSGQVVWSSNTTGIGSTSVQLLESGNLVVSDESGGAAMWQSFDHLSNTQLPGTKIGKNLWTGADWQLTSWRSANDPSAGNFRYMTDAEGVPQNILLDGDQVKYRTGPWNGLWFSGVTEMATYSDMFTYLLTSTPSEVTYGYVAKPGAPFSHVLLTDDGVFRHLVWDHSSRKWKVFFQGPRDICDHYGKCRAFGMCNANAPLASFCSCIKGFSPTSPLLWKIGDTSKGCRRNLMLDCGNGASTTDGFVVMEGVKLPDTHNASVDPSITLEECNTRLMVATLVYSWFVAVTAEAQHPQFPAPLVIGASIASLVVVLLVLLSGTGDALDRSTIREATRNFSEANVIGEGGYSVVYRGQLRDGTMVAVKRLKKFYLTDKGKEDFSREVGVMSTLRHVNLAKLLYYCREEDEWILVYELMENRSLNLYIFGEENGFRSSLNWAQRLEIIGGVAVGVEFLHSKGVIHRDLNPGNILVSDTWHPKITDFATMKLFIDEKTNPALVLMPGYLAPEYSGEWALTYKCDVYSFGVVLLEIVSGRKRTDTPTLLLQAWELWDQRRIRELLDPEVAEPEGDLLSRLVRCIQIGLLCVQRLPEDRPTVTEVVELLTNTSSQLLTPQRPTQLFSIDTPGLSRTIRSDQHLPRGSQ